MVENKCTGIELAEYITGLSPEFQKMLENNSISIDNVKQFKNNPFCAEEKNASDVNFQIFKKFEAFFWILNKLLEDTKSALRNI